MQEYRPILYNYLVLSETLYPHLLEIDNAANQRMDTLLSQLAKNAGVTEKLKAADPLKWVGLMNTAKAQAEEIILAELIYAQLRRRVNGVLRDNPENIKGYSPARPIL